MRVIRPFSTTNVAAVWSSPARSIRAASAPLSSSGTTSQPLEQRGRHLVGDGRRGLAHRLGALHHSPLQASESVGLAPARHLPYFGLVETPVVCHEVAEIQAK